MDMNGLRIGAALAFAASFVFSHGTALSASAEKGKAAFTKYGCWQCHGFQGQGSVATSAARSSRPIRALRRLCGIRAFDQSLDAALQREDTVERRPRGHLRVSAIDPEDSGPQDNPAP
jgi:hypothetical protein